MNNPPYIAAQFVEPAGDVVHVETDAPVTLGVDPLLDPDPEDRLYYAVVGDRSGLVEQATVSRRPADDRYRDRFYRFEGVHIDIDPCGARLRDHGDELIRLHVTDRPFERLTEAEVEVGDDAYLQTHRWVLRFGPQLCD